MKPSNYWEFDGANERAIAAGYELKFIAGHDMFAIYGEEGGGFAVFKDGKLLKRFEGVLDRERWLHEHLPRDEG